MGKTNEWGDDKGDCRPRWRHKISTPLEVLNETVETHVLERIFFLETNFLSKLSRENHKHIRHYYH